MKLNKILLSGLLLLGTLKAFAQPYVGEIRVFAGNFAPAGWEICDGRLLSISEYETLFILIGTTYGGDGEQTFALPDLRGRVPVHQGNGYNVGELGGVETVTLTSSQIPAHNHIIGTPGTFATGVNTDAGTSTTPVNKVLAITKDNNFIQTTGDVQMKPASLKTMKIDPVGGSQPHENMAPTLTATYIISLNGIFPVSN